MRWKFSGYTAALVIVGFVASASTAAAKSRSRAKAKAPKAAPVAQVADKKKLSEKPTELMADDKSISKQMQWEDKVMGPNDKKADLARIARAAAITKAAADKAAADKAAGLDLKESAPAPKPQAKSTLNLPALPDEGDGKGNGSRKDDGKRREISAKLLTEEASAPVPAAKPADDKFIDRLLNSDGPSKKKAAKTSDSQLIQLLAKETDKPVVKTKARGKGDALESVLANADKEGEKTVVKPKQPDWTKPDLPTAAPPPPPPVAVKPAPRKDNGVIQVIQGANTPVPPPAAAAAPAPSPSRRVAAAPSETAPTAAPKQVAAKPANWKDPFSDSNAAARKQAAAAAVPPLSKKDGAAHPPGWRDPFADGPEQNKAKRPASEPKRTNTDSPPPPPAGNPAQWKDPFTEKGATHATVAVAEIPKPEQRKWEIAAARRAKPAPAAGESRSGWGVLKKRAQ
ncbi:MAG TPA: hypothetical protein VFH73_18500 [Polyangia bacterium]|nr:hypothetical protein [Polyangia bacterium]